MKSTLEQLYYGNNYPNDRKLPQTEEYRRSKEDWYHKYEHLLSRLSPEEQTLLDAADSARIHCDTLIEADLFIQAFRLGARVMLEVLS